MSDDLVKRLRDMNGGWASDEALAAADRIEELEAKLAKALVALDEAHTSIMNHCDSDAYLILDHALAELKGQTDDQSSQSRA